MSGTKPIANDFRIKGDDLIHVPGVVSHCRGLKSFFGQLHGVLCDDDDPTLGSGQSYDEDDIADESVFDDDDEPANA